MNSSSRARTSTAASRSQKEKHARPNAMQITKKSARQTARRKAFSQPYASAQRTASAKTTLETANNATSDPSQSEEKHASHGPSEQKTATRTEKSFRQERQRAMPA